MGLHKRVNPIGRPPKFPTPEYLWMAACEYFEWCADNPLKEERVFAYKGIITRTTVDKMRIMTVQGLELWLDVNERFLDDTRDRGPAFSHVVDRIKKTIYNQKLEGASADLLNSSIIAMEIGLKQKAELEHVGNKDKPMEIKVTRRVVDVPSD